MWTSAIRRQYSRRNLRYETNLTYEEWRVLAPFFPVSPARDGPHKWAVREIVNAIFDVLRGGVVWRPLPRDSPPLKSRVFHWFSIVRETCLFERINHALVIVDRERAGRQASPSAAIIDSQSVKTTESSGPGGYDACKKIKGRKRHALVDTDGCGLVLEPHPADVQDRDAAGPVLQASRSIFPFIEKRFADSAYDHHHVSNATSINVEIVRKTADQVGFVVLP